MFISKFIKLLGHYIRYPVDILLLPVSILFGYFHGGIKMYAVLTLNVVSFPFSKSLSACTKHGADSSLLCPEISDATPFLFFPFLIILFFYFSFSFFPFYFAFFIIHRHNCIVYGTCPQGIIHLLSIFLPTPSLGSGYRRYLLGFCLPPLYLSFVSFPRKRPHSALNNFLYWFL